MNLLGDARKKPFLLLAFGLASCTHQADLNSNLTADSAALYTADRVIAQDATLLQNSKYFNYEVLFTNPSCREYPYSSPVTSVSGKPISSRPKHVFCTSRDSKTSGERPNAPLFRMLQWINDTETKEIFFSFLSFSNAAVKTALCNAATQRGVKINFILDSGTDTTAAEELIACGSANNRPKYILRGGQNGLGYAHNKIFIINPSSSDKIKIAFGSANMTSGIVLHHENWHFVTTQKDSYFAQAHLCVMKGYQNNTASSSPSNFQSHMRACRSQIAAREEVDVRAMFIPGDGDRATEFMTRGSGNFPGISSAREISIAAHRFSYGKMLTALSNRIKNGGVRMRFVADDDMYWVGTTGEQHGDNDANEFRNVKNLTDRGAEAKWMETNDRDHLLHHNKYLIFDDRAVFAGAGNLTTAAFTKNFENFYYITIPSVVESFRKQYNHVWENLATAPQDMPREHTIPDTQ
jgi:hypothetical protein